VSSVRGVPLTGSRAAGPVLHGAAAVVLLGWALLVAGIGWWLLPMAYLAVVTPPLVRIDLAEHRLPNPLTLPGYPVALAAIVAGALAGRSPLVPLLGAASYLGILVLAHLGGGMGMGDVKLAGVLGATLGMVGPSAAIAGLALAVLSGGAVATVLLLRGRRHSRLAFGPYLLLGFWLALAWSL
jgi:leader peptidase (prepilin peptidase)/N-methyltransferase